MALEEYRRKRRFAKTSEPHGARIRKSHALTFVVQHHLASHEHHDFRLELDGVLKSWAVPKLVSSKPGVKRLAVQVEDHPLEYGSFEGEIPAGEYGAGTVEIFDHGTWEPEEDPHEALAAGKLAFRLKGRKLTGEWVLVRLKHARGDGAKPQWLLFKRSGSAAR